MFKRLILISLMCLSLTGCVVDLTVFSDVFNFTEVLDEENKEK